MERKAFVWDSKAKEQAKKVGDIIRKEEAGCVNLAAKEACLLQEIQLIMFEYAYKRKDSEEFANKIFNKCKEYYGK